MTMEKRVYMMPSTEVLPISTASIIAGSKIVNSVGGGIFNPIITGGDGGTSGARARGRRGTWSNGWGE